MQPQPVAEEDSAAAIAPPLRPSMPWRVASVEALPGYRLRLRFLDGLEGVVDMSALLPSQTRASSRSWLILRPLTALSLRSAPCAGRARHRP